MRTPLRIAAVAALVLVLAGCTGSGGSSAGGGGSSSDGGGVSGPGVVAPDQPSTGEDSAGDEDGRSQIVTGTLDLVAADPLAVADRARDLIERAGGRLDGLLKEPKSEFREASAQLVARIPADRLENTIDELERLGTVQSLSTKSSDVTQQKTDLDSRIASLQASTDRLRQLITTAATTADLIAIETALSDREAQLESLVAERDYLADQIDFATMTIVIATPASAPTPPPADFWSGVVAGFGALVAALSWTLVAVGAALPWLVFLGLLALIVVALVRLLRGRARGGRPGAPAPEGPAADA